MPQLGPLPLRPSVTLTAFLLLGHGLALFCLLPLVLPWELRLALMVALLLSCAWHLQALWRRPLRWLGAEGGELWLEGADGIRVAGTVHEQTLVLPGLVVLLLRREKGRYSLVLFPDALGADGHRQLRRWLRWNRVPAQPAEPGSASDAGR